MSTHDELFVLVYGLGYTGMLLVATGGDRELIGGYICKSPKDFAETVRRLAMGDVNEFLEQATKTRVTWEDLVRFRILGHFIPGSRHFLFYPDEVEGLYNHFFSVLEPDSIATSYRWEDQNEKSEFQN